MGHGFPRYRDRACRSPKGPPCQGGNQGGTTDHRFVPGARYGSGDFLFPPIRTSPPPAKTYIMRIKHRNVVKEPRKCRDRALTGPQHSGSWFQCVRRNGTVYEFAHPGSAALGFPAERSMPVPYFSAESQALGILESLIHNHHPLIKEQPL